MGIAVEFCPDLALREFGSEGREAKECFPEKLIVGEVCNFLKKGQRNFWMVGEFPLRETKGNGVLSKPLASVVLLEAAHFLKDGEVWTCGRYKIKEVYDPSDGKIHFDGLEKIDGE